MTLERGGLRLGADLLPLYAGAVHYWRLSPEDWHPCLKAVRDLGLGLVDLYVPWGVHERAPGVLELGAQDRRLHVVRFLEQAHALGLYAIVRPGPHINAELTDFGVPERVLWDRECQARGPAGRAVMLPVPPLAFPVPSHASRAYLDEACRYLERIGAELAPLCWPDGPIVMVQVDNEGALFFRDGAYDQDYHPDAIEQYRAFVGEAYQDPSTLQRVHGATEPSAIQAPTRFDADDIQGVARHLDWARFHEELIVTAFGRFAATLRSAGLDRVPTVHNLPMASEATPLNPAQLGEAVDLLGLDYYGGATERERAMHARRTTELVARCDGHDQPAIACEMGAGYPPYFPPLAPEDSAFTVLSALAYGLRGFNLFMAVARDRWIGAPIDERGEPQEFARFWGQLVAALHASRLHRLHRPTSVRLVVPRVERRLQRVLHAFGPASGAMLAVLGVSPRHSCLETDLGLGHPLVVGADELAERAAAALERLGVPFAWVDGGDGEAALGDAAWILCTTSGAVEPELRAALRNAADRGARITVGPHPPAYDGSFRPASPDDRRRLEGRYDLLSESAEHSVERYVARMVDALELECHRCEPSSVQVTVHYDDAGAARVLFLVNAGEAVSAARVQLGRSVRSGRCVDALTGTETPIVDGRLVFDLAAGSVAMLHLR
ncbi:MAG: beta-galactosidase [Deltaproteobacteria bacterium]|nr:beta-galactosidase [Deltaproteobacteria bacterium]